MARRPTNPLALAVLTLLSERPMHPYEMSATLRERQKEASIKLNYGSLYSVVESLQKSGMITAQETVRQGRRPERTVYAITDEGRRRMVDWLSDLLAQPAKEFTQFEAALSLMPILPPDEVEGLLRQRLNALVVQQNIAKAFLAEAAAKRFPRLFLIESEYVMALADAEITFVRGLLEEIRDGSFEGLQIWQRVHDLRDTGMSPDEVDATITAEFKEELSGLHEFTGDAN